MTIIAAGQLLQPTIGTGRPCLVDPGRGKKQKFEDEQIGHDELGQPITHSAVLDPEKKSLNGLFSLLNM